LFVLYIRHYYEVRATELNDQITSLNNQITALNYRVTSLNDQLHFHELAIEEKRAQLKVTILTLETREVSFWRESLGNKIKYARRHG
jgi:predicted  nucleic acid-binding Zn-ribbon protein